MDMKKEEKIRVIKWYISHYLNTKTDYSEVVNLKNLEEIVRTATNCFAKSNRCNQCTSDGKSYCKRCANCIEWHWDNDIVETADNYRFRYTYWKTFSDMETK
jgi:lipopolysaccharide biosynthesis regulator YciM